MSTAKGKNGVIGYEIDQCPKCGGADMLSIATMGRPFDRLCKKCGPVSILVEFATVTDFTFEPEGESSTEGEADPGTPCCKHCGHVLDYHFKAPGKEVPCGGDPTPWDELTTRPCDCPGYEEGESDGEA